MEQAKTQAKDQPKDARINLEELVEQVAKLISIDSTSSSGNLGAIEYLQQQLRKLDVSVQVIKEDSDLNANLIAVFNPPGELEPKSATYYSSELIGDLAGTNKAGIDRLNPQSGERSLAAEPKRRGILIAGHADCVPVTDQLWLTPPFEPTVKDEKLYGRGSSDMKSYLAVFVALAKYFKAAKLSEPIYFAATWDEEISCDGARELVKQLAALNIHPRIAYVGEPTMMEVITSHKSMNAFDVEFSGIAAHSSLLPMGLNSIRYAAKFTEWFHQELDRKVASETPDPAFIVPHVTGGINILNGGIAGNTVPAKTVLQGEFRALPDDDPIALIKKVIAKVEQIDQEMKAAIPQDPADSEQAKNVGASFKVRSLLYSLAASKQSPAVELAKALKLTIAEGKVTYGTESGIYEAAGMSAVVIGPGDIAQAHGANEYVELSQLVAAAEFMLKLLDHFSNSGRSDFLKIEQQKP